MVVIVVIFVIVVICRANAAPMSNGAPQRMHGAYTLRVTPFIHPARIGGTCAHVVSSCTICFNLFDLYRYGA